MVESRKRREREVRLDYAFDRLLATKLQQVYEILVPDQVRVISNSSALNGEANENRGDLRQVSLDMVSNGRIRNCSRFLSQEKRWRPSHILIAKSWHETCLTSIYSLVL